MTDQGKPTPKSTTRKVVPSQTVTAEARGAATRARRLIEELEAACARLERPARTEWQQQHIDRTAAFVERMWLLGKKPEIDQAMRLLDACEKTSDPSSARTILAARVPEIAAVVSDADLSECIALMSRARRDWYAVTALLNRLLGGVDLDPQTVKKQRKRWTK